ncbi:MAG TPA: tetratricopeptide repeat protein [Opitutaceae bacterium]|nr:tetratricopeptide repeat protein [Opitutaceae bacterium]
MAPGRVSPAAPDDAPARASRRWILTGAGAIVLAAVVAYHNSLSCPFVFDDLPAIVDNPTIRHLEQIGQVLSPAANGGGSAGRPLFNLTLAVNYALGGLDVRGYHVVNLALHALAGLALFGVVRRTLRLRSGRALESGGRLEKGAKETGAPPWTPPVPMPLRDAVWVGGAAALLWTVHPLLTESVTGVVNRAEILAGLFTLLTLYGFIRSTTSPRPAPWQAFAVGACLLGMASKEWVVSVPILVWLYDRTFVAGSLRAAWRRRRGLYLGLAATWPLLALLMIGSHHRNQTVGFGLGVSPGSFALTQCLAVARYLRLSLWPHPLVFDYGTSLVRDPLAVAPQAALLGLLGVGAARAVWRGRAAGFAGVVFFAILAPSSSVVPLTTQTIAEHRMYLPLAAAVVAAVLGLHALAGRRALVGLVALAVALGALTVRRNEDFRSEFSVWSDTVAKWPDNARAHHRLGILLLTAGRPAEAIGQYREALRIEPGNPDIRIALAHALVETGRIAEAIDCYEQILRARPELAEVHNNLGIALVRAGRGPEGSGHFEEALRLKPDYAEAHNNLGVALMQADQVPPAADHFEAAARLKPGDADAHLNLGNAWVRMGRAPEAIGQYEQALRINPGLAEAHDNLAQVLAGLGRIPEAIRHYEELLRIEPANGDARRNLARLRAMLPPGAAGP